VDVIEIGMVAVGFLGLSLCAMREMHVKVDLVVSLLPKRAQRIIVSFGYLIGLGICILLSWQAFQEGIAVRELNTLSSTLEIPVFPFYWVVALGFALLCLAILVFLARSLTQAIKG
jgi:TRAP-type C4-dicarboxylate transport system permease small subunit